ncbi:MAG: hypothetical protein U0636_02395 [Phycisphaerales bacterium]
MQCLVQCTASAVFVKATITFDSLLLTPEGVSEFDRLGKAPVPILNTAVTAFAAGNSCPESRVIAGFMGPARITGRALLFSLCLDR